MPNKSRGIPRFVTGEQYETSNYGAAFLYSASEIPVVGPENQQGEFVSDEQAE